MPNSTNQDSMTVSNAGVLVRFAALLYDGLLVLGLWFVVSIIFVGLNYAGLYMRCIGGALP